MRLLGKIAVCLAGGLVLSAGARAGDLVSAANPYEPIVARNIFSLLPVTTPIITPTSESENLPKITPNGIMSILGQLQVLYKVSPKPGQKDAKEQCYVLSEGQAQDDIEVVRIDEKRTLVTFNNHGTVQEIPLANTPKITAQPFPGGGNSSGGGIPPRIGGPKGAGGGPAGRFNTTNHGLGGAGGNSPGGTGDNPALNSTATRGRGAAAGQITSPADLSAEDHMVLMAAQHLKAQESGDPAAAIFPPTPFDADAGINPPPLPTAPSTSGRSSNARF
jgi:hypothetical protein